MDENINPSTNLNPAPSPTPTVENLPVSGESGFDKKLLAIVIGLVALLIILGVSGYYFLVMQPQQVSSPATTPGASGQSEAPIVKEETVENLYSDLNSIETSDTSEDFTASDTAGL